MASKNNPEFSIITWVNKPELYDGLVKSCSHIDCEFICVDQKFNNMSSAYNFATDKAKGKFLVYCHQDIEILDTQFCDKVRFVFNNHKDIGFLGPIGSITNHRKRLWFNEGHENSRGWILQGNRITGCGNYNGIARLLDGLMMITDKRMDFPEFLPGIHCLDTMMCMQAESQGLRNWITPLAIRHWSEGDTGSPDIDVNSDYLLRFISQKYKDSFPDDLFDPAKAFWHSEGLYDCDGSDLTVVIPVLNQIEHTKECLESLKKDVPQATVIIIDNNSLDDTSVVIKRDFPWVKYVKNTFNAGVAASWNQGAALSDTDLICFLNNDTIVQPDGMRMLVREARRVGASTVVGRMLNPNFTCGPITENTDQMHYPEAFALILTRDTYKKVGPFDERFWPAYSEDADYGIRMLLAGIKCAIVPNSIAHKGSATSPEIPDIADVISANRQKLFKKWSKTPNIHKILTV